VIGPVKELLIKTVQEQLMKAVKKLIKNISGAADEGREGSTGKNILGADDQNS
jgi:hypothetical protein